jgi:hypothetical protein
MCNCKKNRNETIPVVTIPVVTMVPEPTPLPQVDHFNNIDTIEPIQNGE